MQRAESGDLWQGKVGEGGCSPSYLLAARELELGPAQGLNHMLLVLQLGAMDMITWTM